MQAVLVVNFKDGVPGCLLDRAFRQLGAFRALADHGTMYDHAYATDPDPARAAAGSWRATPAGRGPGGAAAAAAPNAAPAQGRLLAGFRAQGYAVEVQAPGAGAAPGPDELATLASLARRAGEAAAAIRAWGAPREGGPPPALLVEVSNGRDALRV